jgi:hypothetical protein
MAPDGNPLRDESPDAWRQLLASLDLPLLLRRLLIVIPRPAASSLDAEDAVQEVTRPLLLEESMRVCRPAHVAGAHRQEAALPTSALAPLFA